MAAVAIEQAVHFVDDPLGIGAAQQAGRDLVERALEVVGGLQRLAAHPQHAVAMIVRHQCARAHRVDVLRGQRHADHHEVAPAPAHDGTHVIARAELVREREGLRQHDFVRLARLRVAPCAQRQPVEERFAVLRHGHQLAHDGFVEACHVEHRAAHHARLDGLDAIDRRDALRQAGGRALDLREHVGEPIALVVGGRRVPQRLERRQGHDQQADAGRNDESDRKDLSPQAPEVAQQLAIEGVQPHGVTTPARAPVGAARCVVPAGCVHRPAPALDPPCRR